MLRRIFAISGVVLGFFCFANAQDAAVQEKTWKVFSSDMPKDTVGTVKLKLKLGTMYEVTHDEASTFSPSEEDKKRGYVLFIKRLGEPMYPNTVPQKSELSTDMTLTAVSGQSEAGYLAVYPLADLDEIKVSVSDLSAGSGNIPANAVEICNVLYDFEPEGNAWICRAKYMSKGGIAKGYKEIPRPFTFTVRVPENAAPGDYKGKINISAGGKTTDINLSLKVLPFKFEPLTDDHIFFLYTHTNISSDTAYLELMMKDLRAHGMTAVLTEGRLGDYADIESASFPLKLEAMKRFGALLKKHGFTKWLLEIIPGQEMVKKLKCNKYDKVFDEAYIGILKQVKDAEKKYGWPEVVFYYNEPVEYDEMGRPGGDGRPHRPDISNLLRLHENTGVEFLVTYMFDTNGKRADDQSIMSDYSVLADKHKYPAVFGFEGSEKIMNAVKKAGKKQLLYQGGYSRFAFGLLPVKYGAYGQANWEWTNGRAKLTSLTEFPLGTGVIVTDTGIVEVLRYNESREGIDDYRYAYTLIKAIERAKNNNSPAVTKAQSLLKEIEALPIEPAKNGVTGEWYTMTPYMLEKYNAKMLCDFRARIIESIMEINKENTDK